MIAKELKRFFIYTFLSTWIIWSIALLKSYKVINVLIPNEVIVQIGSFAPSVVAVILTLIYGSRKNLKEFLKSGVSIKFNIKLYFYMLLLMPCILFVSYIFTKLIWNLEIDLPLLENPMLIVVAFFYILLLGGPLGEEFGWRGFALNRLLYIYNPMVSSLILGIIWSIWHLPLFFIDGTVQQSINFIGYTIITILFSILITVLFMKTNFSVFSAIIIHTTSNLSYGIFPIFTTLQGGINILFLMLLATVIILILNRDIMFKKEVVTT